MTMRQHSIASLRALSIVSVRTVSQNCMCDRSSYSPRTEAGIGSSTASSSARLLWLHCMARCVISEKVVGFLNTQETQKVNVEF